MLLSLATLSLTALSLGTAALAAAQPDLTTTFTAPATPSVYASAKYTVSVYNAGTATASGSSVVIQLPVTATTTVTVMGTLGAKSASCTQSGTKLTCTLGSLAKRKTVSVYFYLALPESENALTITAAAATTTTESNSGNNNASLTASLNNYVVSFTGTRDVQNDHCTGNASLSSYFECTLYPSSISSHDATFNDDGTISIPDAPDYTGDWRQPTTDSLSFEYYDETGALVVEFEGYGTTTGCWEGITTFPDSPAYESPYHVCLQ